MARLIEENFPLYFFCFLEPPVFLQRQRRLQFVQRIDRLHTGYGQTIANLPAPPLPDQISKHRARSNGKALVSRTSVVSPAHFRIPRKRGAWQLDANASVPP